MEDKSKHIICSVSVAAFNLGITVQGLNQWIKKNNFKKDGRNVDFTEILFLRREQAEQQEQDLSDTEKKLKAEAKYKGEKAKQEEMITLQMMGELIPQEQVKNELEMLFMDIRQQILTIPDNIKTRIYSISPDIAQDCEEVTHDIIQKCLTRLASGDNASRAENVGEKPTKRYTKRQADVSTAAAGNRKRVGRQ